MDAALALLKGKLCPSAALMPTCPRGSISTRSWWVLRVIDQPPAARIGVIRLVLIHPAQWIYQVKGQRRVFTSPFPACVTSGMLVKCGCNFDERIATVFNKFDIMTLVPDAIDAMMGQSIMGRLQERAISGSPPTRIRDYTTNKRGRGDQHGRFRRYRR